MVVLSLLRELVLTGSAQSYFFQNKTFNEMVQNSPNLNVTTKPEMLVIRRISFSQWFQETFLYYTILGDILEFWEKAESYWCFQILKLPVLWRGKLLRPLKSHTIVHLTFVCLVAKPFNRSEAKGDLVMIQILLLFKCKLPCYHAN